MEGTGKQEVVMVILKKGERSRNTKGFLSKRLKPNDERKIFVRAKKEEVLS